jgi:hypothetical protein
VCYGACEAFFLNDELLDQINEEAKGERTIVALEPQ